MAQAQWFLRTLRLWGPTSCPYRLCDPMHIPYTPWAFISHTYKISLILISLTSLMVLLIRLWELNEKINGDGGDGDGNNDDDNTMMMDLPLINKTAYLHSRCIFKFFIPSTH